MISEEHEMTAELFRNRPELARELLEGTFGIELPEYDKARTDAGDCTDFAPVPYRADAVVVFLSADILHKERFGSDVVMTVVVEVQRKYKDSKAWTWPLYLATLRARNKSPVMLLVICPDEKEARKCRQEIYLGHPGWVLCPLVVSPASIPTVTDSDVAAQSPELAVLSAVTHGADPAKGKDILRAMHDGFAALDPDKAYLYADYVLRMLPAAPRAYLEELLTTGTAKYRSDYALRCKAEGRAEGLAEGRAEGRAEGLVEGRAEGYAMAVLDALSQRGVAVPQEAAERIQRCTDLAQLKEWHGRALTAESVDELFA
jgi:hypothetical protein